MLPRRFKREKMRVREPERRLFPTHRAFVKRHQCCVPGCPGAEIEFAHAKTRGSGGHDAQGISLCKVHHVEQHTIGIETFMEKYKVNLFVIAAEFAAKTTDKALRAALQERDDFAPGKLVALHARQAAE